MKRVAAAIFVATLASWGSPDATSYIAIREFIPDTTLRSSDSVPPLPPTITQTKISRGRGPYYTSGGGYSTTPDDDLGSIYLVVSNGDGSPVSIDDVGYRFYQVDGELPGGQLSRGTWKAFREGQGATLSVHSWADGATWEQEAFSFRMCVIAIDRAGNESAPSDTILVADDGKQGRFASDEAAKQAAQRDRDALAALEGRWTGTIGGATASFVVSGQEFSLVEGANTITGAFWVSTHDEGPVSIDLTVESGLAVRSPLQGIYELSGDNLRLCIEKPDTRRPSSFVDSPNQSLYRLERAR